MSGRPTVAPPGTAMAETSARGLRQVTKVPRSRGERPSPQEPTPRTLGDCRATHPCRLMFSPWLTALLEGDMHPSVLPHSVPLAIDLNQPGTYLHWSIFEISVANLVVIAVMVVIFGAALLLPFPHARQLEPAAPRGRGHSRPGHGRGGRRQDVDEPGPAAGAADATAAEAAARPAAGLRGVLGVRVRRGQPGRAGAGDRLRAGHRARRGRLVAHQPGRAFLQQPAPVERRAVHGLDRHPPVGQVLDGRLARPPGA